MCHLGNRLLARKRRKNGNTRENVLRLSEIEKLLSNSHSYQGAIYISSFRSLIVKASTFSFLVYCKNHWFVIYSSKDTIEIFDSLGFLQTKECVSRAFLKFLSNLLGHKQLKASHTLQPDGSNLCGIYSLYFIIMRDKGKTFEEIMDTFSTDLQKNDNLMQRFSNKLDG